MQRLRPSGYRAWWEAARRVPAFLQRAALGEIRMRRSRVLVKRDFKVRVTDARYERSGEGRLSAYQPIAALPAAGSHGRGHKRAFPAFSDQPETDVMFNREPDNGTCHFAIRRMLTKEASHGAGSEFCFYCL